MCLAERALKRNGTVYKNFGRFRAGACAGPPLADGFAGDAALTDRSSLSSLSSSLSMAASGVDRRASARDLAACSRSLRRAASTAFS